MPILDNTTINQPVLNIGALKTIPYSQLANGCQVYVTTEGNYVWSKDSATAANDKSVVAATGNTGNGRWLKQNSSEIIVNTASSASTNSMFNKVQDAINFVETYFKTTPIVIKLGAGVFSEDINIKGNITIIGSVNKSQVNSITIDNSADATVDIKNLNITSSSSKDTILSKGAGKLIARFSNIVATPKVSGKGFNSQNSNSASQFYLSDTKFVMGTNTGQSITMSDNQNVHLHNVEVSKNDFSSLDVVHQKGTLTQTGYLKCGAMEFSSAASAAFDNVMVNTDGTRVGIKTTATGEVIFSKLVIREIGIDFSTQLAIDGTGLIKMNPATTYFIGYSGDSDRIGKSINSTQLQKVTWFANPAIFIKRLEMAYEEAKLAEHIISNATCMVLVRTNDLTRKDGVGNRLPVTVILPQVGKQDEGRFLIIKDKDGTAGDPLGTNGNVNDITIRGTIDGIQNPKINTNYGVMRIMYTGTEWITW